MNLAVLRAEGPEAALRAVASALGLRAASFWREGDASPTGRLFTSTGFNCTLADASNPAALVLAIQEFARVCRESKFVFPPEVKAELSVGVTVGDSEQFVAVVDFSANELRALGELGLGLSFAAYPTSDEANQC